MLRGAETKVRVEVVAKHELYEEYDARCETQLWVQLALRLWAARSPSFQTIPLPSYEVRGILNR